MTLVKHIFVILFSVLCGCSKDVKPKEYFVDRTILMYMLPSNLTNYMQNNLKSMVTGAKKINLSPKVNIIVYYNPDNKTPYLLRITKDGMDTIRSYEKHNGATPEALSSIIKEVKQKYPASSYGLLMSSHGTGWLAQGMFTKSYTKHYNSVADMPLTKTFGVNYHNNIKEEIEIWELAQAIPDKAFEFILFDACYMITAETTYELRHKCNYIIGSVAETPAHGVPYDLIMDDIFATIPNLKGICKKYYEFYNAKVDGWERTGLTTLIKTSEMDNLANVVRLTMEKYKGNIKTLYLKDIQRFDMKLTESAYFQYDFEHYMEKICSDPILLQAIKDQLKNVVIVKYETPVVLDEIKIIRHCGLSCFIPKTDNTHFETNTKTQWYKTIMGESN